MKHNRRKRKKPNSPAPQPALTVVGRRPNMEGEEVLGAASVAEAFNSISLEEAQETTAEFLHAYILHNSDDPSTSSSSSVFTGSDFGLASSSNSSSGWSEGVLEADKGSLFKGNGKQKKLIAATGTVSTVLGKDYMKAGPRKEATELSFIGKRVYAGDAEEAEQFLCAMLGDDTELGLGVVRDVLCQCGYNVDQALDILLDMSGSSDEQLNNRCFVDDVTNKENARFVMNNDENLADMASESASSSYESEGQNSVWSLNSFSRNYFEVLVGSETQGATSGRNDEPNVPQEVLESFYKNHKSPQREPNTMNWRNVATKMSHLSTEPDACNSIEEPSKGDEYKVFRKEAQLHWNSMKTSYQKASTAHSKGEKGYAAYLSEQGRKQSALGQQADEKASQEIFRVRNKDIENIITIDLHGQHVKQAMRILKFHILLPSIQKLRVITGCGSHGAGKSKLKQMVLRLVEAENIKVMEENRATLLLKLDGTRKYNFVDLDSDSDND